MPNMKREGNKCDDRPALHLMWCRFFNCQICQSLKRGKEVVDIQVENAQQIGSENLSKLVISNAISKAMEIKV